MNPLVESLSKLVELQCGLAEGFCVLLALMHVQARGLPQQQQQQALAAQQALLMQAAASGNLALLQASRGLYLQNAAQQQQLMQPMLMQAAAAAGGMGVPGLNALRPNALQMIQVVAQDGTLHQVPAQALMQLQLAGGLGQQQLGAAVQASSGQQAVPASSAGAAAASAAPVQQPISLLSLLNGTGTTSGNSG